MRTKKILCVHKLGINGDDRTLEKEVAMKNRIIKVQDIDIAISKEKMEAGLHTFVLSVSEWVEQTNAVGLYVKRGKYGGTYAHRDIAFEFASAISPVFKLYLIKEFQRLKENENRKEEIE